MPDSELSEAHIYMLLVTFNLKLLTNGSNFSKLSKHVLPMTKSEYKLIEIFYFSFSEKKEILLYYPNDSPRLSGNRTRDIQISCTKATFVTEKLDDSPQTPLFVCLAGCNVLPTAVEACKTNKLLVYFVLSVIRSLPLLLTTILFQKFYGCYIIT